MATAEDASSPRPAPAAGSVDIITIENLKSKMPQWLATSRSQLYALVDMGSNGIRFSISDLSPPRTRLLRCIYQDRVPISLLDALLDGRPKGGGSVGGEGDFFPEGTIAEVARAVRRFRAIALTGYRVPAAQMAIFATEAMRRAANAADMLDAIRTVAPDVAVHVLDPAVETLFGAMGARASFANVKGLFLDLGGGSLQMSYLDTFTAAPLKSPPIHSISAVRVGMDADGEAEDAPTSAGRSPGYGIHAAQTGQSLPYGAARMTHVIEHEKSHVLDAELASLRAGLASALKQLQLHHPAVKAAFSPAADSSGTPATAAEQAIDFFLYGGGFRGYGSLLLFKDPIQPYPFPTVAGYTASADHFTDIKTMRRVNKKTDHKIVGMSARRRHQFPAIAAVVDALTDVLGPRIGRVTFCAGGNREGALMMTLPESIRELDPIGILAQTSPAWLPVIARGGGPVARLLASVDSVSAAMFESITSTLISALPEGVMKLPERRRFDVFSLGLGPLFARQMWVGAGGDGADSLQSASEAMHAALTLDPGSPGLGHLSRAALAVTLVARFGGAVPALEEPRLQGLRGVVAAAGLVRGGALTDTTPLFWADYIGAAAAAVAKVVTTWPANNCTSVGGVGLGPLLRFHPGALLRFHPSPQVKETFALDMDVGLPLELDFDTAELTAPFKRVGKNEGRKVVATAHLVQGPLEI